MSVEIVTKAFDLILSHRVGWECRDYGWIFPLFKQNDVTTFLILVLYGAGGTAELTELDHIYKGAETGKGFGNRVVDMNYEFMIDDTCVYI